MLTYGQVEAALAKLHFINDDAMGAFRGRIKHFQRIGIVPASPGRGKKIAYNLGDLLLWAYCLELSQFGLDPTMIKTIVDMSMTMFFLAYREAGETDGDVLLVLRPNFMTYYIYSNIYDDHAFHDTHNEERHIMQCDIIYDASDINKATLRQVYSRRCLFVDVKRLRCDLEVALRNIDGAPKELFEF